MTFKTRSNRAEIVYNARRILHPRMRRDGATGIVHNSASSRRYGCVCGDPGITMCNRWPVTVRVKAWIAEHERTCGAALVHAVIAGS